MEMGYLEEIDYIFQWNRCFGWVENHWNWRIQRLVSGKQEIQLPEPLEKQISLDSESKTRK
jgi:hypothetical protein